MNNDDFILGKGTNKYQQRVSNKKYLAKKKRYHERAAWLWEASHVSGDIFSETSNGDTWLVSELKQSTSWKVLSCFSRISWDTKLIELLNDEVASSVVIWDYVVLTQNTVQSIVTRSNLLARYKGDSDRFSLHKRVLHPIAANLDYVVIVASAKDPRFQPGFIDRYMLLAQSCSIPAIICISKSDLTKLDDQILKWYEESLSVPVVYTSSHTWEGVDSLKNLIKWKTVVFVWKSWVWKSSLANSILWSGIIHTSAVSEKWWQWRHTTTTSKMHEWDKQSFIVDTPWIRSLDFLEFSKEELQLYFPEFEEPSKSCRFRDCLHHQEPDCEVKDAVKIGTIPESRYTTYLRLLDDIL